LQRLLIDPVTRVCGDAALEVVPGEDGEPAGVLLRASGFRGFERILQGARLENLVPLVSRICGPCSVSHQMAACRAVESALGIRVSEAARKMRELLMLGHLLSGHALTLTIQSLPDLLFPKSDVAVRNILSIYRVEEEIARKVFSLRFLGSQIIRALGGNPVHPLGPVPGGMLRPLKDEQRMQLLEAMTRAEPLVEETARLLRMLLKRNAELSQEMGGSEACFLACGSGEGLALEGEDFRLLSPDGSVRKEGGAEELTGMLKEEPLPHTFLKQALTEEGTPFRVGPLARLAAAKGLGTPMAEAELAELQDQGGWPPQRAMQAHAARMVEMVHAWERMVALLGDGSLTGEEVRTPVSPAAGKGVGIVEAPEGLLIYDLELEEDGRVARLNIISPLQCNHRPLLEDLLLEARRLSATLETEEEARNRLEMMFRAYAPCLPCGVH